MDLLLYTRLCVCSAWNNLCVYVLYFTVRGDSIRAGIKGDIEPGRAIVLHAAVYMGL